MKKKIFALAGLLLFGMLTAVPAKADDGEIQVTDAVLLKKYLLGQQSITEEQFHHLDRNQDGKINVYDMIHLKQELISVRAESFAPEIQLDETRSVNWAVWNSALSDTSYIIKSETELDEIIRPLVREAIVRSLEKTYDADFFAEHILLLDFRAQTYGDAYETSISGVTRQEDGIHVTYERTPIDSSLNKKEILIGQVSLPKSQYHEEAVIWEEKDQSASAPETRLDYEFASEILMDSNYNTFGKKQLITSYDELTEFINAVTSDENAETLAYYQKKYPEEFFETKAVYLFIEYSAGANYSVWRVSKSENQIIINQRINESSGCVIEEYLCQVTLDKSDIENAEITCRNISLYGKTFDGELCSFDVPYPYHIEYTYHDAIYVNFYQFRDEYQLDFYLGDYIGVNGYDYTLIGSVVYDGEENPFSGNYETASDESGVYYTGENSRLEYSRIDGKDILTVTYPDGNGEAVTQTFEIP